MIAARSVARMKDKVRTLTRRNRGVSLVKMIAELNEALRGWINYFRLTQGSPSELDDLDSWIRRKLRCYRLKQRKRTKPIAKFLMSLGVSERNAVRLGSSSKGWWRLSSTPPVQQAMSNAWFKRQGLINLAEQRALLNV